MHKIFRLLNLSLPELRDMAAAVTSKKNGEALRLLRNYYAKRKSYTGFLEGSIYPDPSFENKAEHLQASELIVKNAQAFSEQHFLFQEAWDMERTHETVTFEGEIQWDYTPKGDPEWTYMLNRQAYFPLYAHAYWLTGDASFFDVFCYQINHWMKTQLFDESRLWTSWRTIDTGIRLRNWIKSLEIFIHHENFPENLLADILVSIHEQLLYLAQHANGRRIQTNWLILETNGAYLANCFLPEFLSQPSFIKKNVDMLNLAANSQISNDGLHWEQSFQYHNEVFLKLIEVWLIGQRNTCPLPYALLAIIKKMATATLFMTKPDGTQSNYGDSDSESLGPLLILASLVLKDPTLAMTIGQTSPGLDVFFAYGRNTWRDYRWLGTDYRPETSMAFPDTGLYFMRTGFEPLATFSLFKCGFLGHGHGHDDLLHLAISAYGEDLLVDSGRYNYEEKHHDRLAFKLATAHNTTVVDGQPFNRHLNAWSASKVASPINQKHRFQSVADFVEGGHTGYLSLDSPVLVNRKVVFIKPDIWVITDEFFTQGHHTYEQHFHFNQKTVTQLDAQRIHYQGKTAKLTLYSLSTGGTWRLEDCQISNDYNAKYTSKKAIFQFEQTGPTILTTVLHAQPIADPTILKIAPIAIEHEYGMPRAPEIVTCLSLNCQNAPLYLLINHQEDQDSRRAYWVNERAIFGRVVLFDDRKEQPPIRLY